ncbi:MAG: hypothetical protein C0448_14850 [Sphingobacteriaceae bacterium]|nr:hypothetical protein [Sphingobacteriaceae bacterium]
MKSLICSISILLSGLLFSQKPVDVKLNLRDGSSISGSTVMSDVNLKTKYGQLVIPIKNISSLEVGLGDDKATADKANVYLKVLNSNSTEELKKAAYSDLVKLGIKAIPAIIAFQEDSKNMTEETIVSDYSIDQALSELKNTYHVSDATRMEDVVFIEDDLKMSGSYDFVKLDVKTEYGNLSIPKEKIKSIEVLYSMQAEGNEIVLKLMASKHISGNQNGGWLKTGITLKAGQKFSITASGEVTLASLSNQKYKPDGSYVAANGTSYPSTVSDDYGTGSTYPTYGNVVYKIGETSYDALRAGAKFSGSAKTSGMLLISIYETVYNASNTGSYTVKISLK